MNCKPGDLCVITQGEFAGRLIRITAPDDYPFPPAPAWLYEPPHLEMANGEGTMVSFFDKILRPIRDQPGAGKPAELPASARSTEFSRR